jgi:hypothetical protein
MPMLACPGVHAITSEPVAIRVTDRVNAARRPWRSAYRPRRKLPTGRIRNPTAKMPAVLSNWLVGLPCGKKTGAKYSANAV